MSKNDIKLGFKMMKYGLQFKTMVIMFIIFFVCGTLFELTGMNGNLGGIYLIILGTYVYQMIITSTISTYVSSSPKALKIQSVIPGFFTCATMLIGYTYFVVLRFIHTGAWNLMEDTAFIKESFSGLILVGALAFVIQIYNGFAYKYYLASMILLLLIEVPLIMFGVNDYFPNFIPTFSNAWYYIIIGYVIIIAGGAIGMFVSNLLKRKPLDPKTYKSAMSRAA